MAKVSIDIGLGKDHRSVPVTGAYGGKLPTSEGFVIHFYMDYASLPKKHIIEYNEETNAITEQSLEVDPGQQGERIVQVSTVMTHEVAVNVARWLNKELNIDSKDSEGGNDER